MNRIIVIKFAFTLVLAGVIPAQAELLVYEPFDYPAGTDLDEATGALGTTGNWTDNGLAPHSIALDSTGFSNTWTGIPSGGYPNAGGFVLGDRIDDNSGSIGLAESVTATFVDGTSTWMSFVSGSTNDGVEANNHHKPNLAIGAGILDDNRAEFATDAAIGGGADRDSNASGFLSASYWDGSQLAPRVNSSTVARANLNQQLIVMRIDWGAASDTVSLFAYDISSDVEYIAPAEDAFNFGAVAITTAANFDQSTFNLLSFHGSRSSFDEIRIGTTFEDVTTGGAGPPPPPFAITDFSVNENILTVTWRSKAGKKYIVRPSLDLEDWSSDFDDDVDHDEDGNGDEFTTVSFDTTGTIVQGESNWFVRVDQKN